MTVNKELPIPELVQIAYALLLDSKLLGLSNTMKQTGAFESGCRYWMNKQIDEVVKRVSNGSISTHKED